MRHIRKEKERRKREIEYTNKQEIRRREIFWKRESENEKRRERERERVDKMEKRIGRGAKKRKKLNWKENMRVKTREDDKEKGEEEKEEEEGEEASVRLELGTVNVFPYIKISFSTMTIIKQQKNIPKLDRLRTPSSSF